MNLTNLTFEKLKWHAEHFSVLANDSYIEAYPEFLKYFDSLDKIEKHHLIIASHFVYGWMPTIIHLDIKEIDRVLPLLNAAKSGHILELEELEILKRCINNSMVGLSKLLHFINPTHYAIWDSRIFTYITEKKSQYGIAKAKNYLAYLKKLTKIENHEDYLKLHQLVQKHFKYPISPKRAIEILMFESDRNKKMRNDRFAYTSIIGLEVIKREGHNE